MIYLKVYILTGLILISIGIVTNRLNGDRLKSDEIHLIPVGVMLWFFISLGCMLGYMYGQIRKSHIWLSNILVKDLW